MQKKMVAGGEIGLVMYCFFRAIDTNQWLSGKGYTVNQATWVLFLMHAETLCSASASNEPVITLTHSLFILLYSLFFCS